MRSSMLAACLTFLMLAWPAAAQRAPSQPPDTPASTLAERVVLDAVFWVLPGPVNETCMQLPPGRVTITLRLEDVGVPQPVGYRFSPYWYRAADISAEIQTSVTRDPKTFEATLAGGRYCYAIVHEAQTPVAAAIDSADAPDRSQLVAVRMALIPR